MTGAFILAQAVETTKFIPDIDVVPIDKIWEQITSLTWLQAVIAMSFGTVYVAYGWRIFKVLVMVSFALVGMFLGIFVGQQLGDSVNHQIWGGVIGLGVLAAVSVPMMRWCVCLLGAAAGGVITSGLWYALGLPQVYIWAGAIIGIIAGGMISFIVFKVAVMLFTSLGGSVIMVVAMLSLLYQYENISAPATTHVHDFVFNHNWFLPVALLVPTVIGIITQNKMIKHSQKWEL